MAKKIIYLCTDIESYTGQMMQNRGACGYYDYLQAEYAIRKGVSPVVTTNMAFLDIRTIDRGYDVYLCYSDKTLKIENEMTIPVAWAGSDVPKVIEDDVFCDIRGVYVERPKRSFGSLLEAFMSGLFNEALGIKPYDPKPKASPCASCGNCGYFMRYMMIDGTPGKDGDCGSIGMNRECSGGVNPFKSDYATILQVGDNEKACGFFKVTRPRRVTNYIKEHADLYVQE